MSDFAKDTNVPTNDCISRQAAIDAVEKESQVDCAYGYMDTKSIVDLLSDLPSAEPKKGKWEKQLTRNFLDSRVNVGVEMKEATGRGYHTYVNLMCTNCRKVTMVSESILYKYCPHCGAKMEVNE
jgi:hypothetical protein